jgi:hypothetical protein
MSEFKISQVGAISGLTLFVAAYGISPSKYRRLLPPGDTNARAAQVADENSKQALTGTCITFTRSDPLAYSRAPENRA